MQRDHPKDLPPYSQAPTEIVMAKPDRPKSWSNLLRRPFAHIAEQLRAMTGWGLDIEAADPTTQRYSLGQNVEGVTLSYLSAGGVVATDAKVRVAMRFAFEHFKIVAEPGAVDGLAAILSGKAEIKGRTIATFITGGNIDSTRFATLIGDQT